LHLAQVSTLKSFVLRGGILFAGLLALILFFPRKDPKRIRMWRAVLLTISALIIGTLFATGRLPADRFVSRIVPGMFVDLHTHGSDPVDGSITCERLYERAAARGLGFYAVTNHDAMCPDSRALPGIEWSGYRHPEQPYIHLLFLFGEGYKTLELRVPPLLDSESSGKDQALQAVRVAKEANCVVIVAHYWATMRSMAERNLQEHLPSLEELVHAGVDGFEVANRSPFVSKRDRSLVTQIDNLCRSKGLLRIAVSDDHGIPAGSPCVTFIEGTVPQGREARRAFVETHLRSREGVYPLSFPDRHRPSEDAPFFDVIFWFYRYLGSLNFEGRVSWFLWLAASGWLTRIRFGRTSSSK
jgi:hypothetical protein